MKPFVICLILMLTATAALSQTTATDWFAKGNAATDQNEKIRCYTQAIRLDPKYANAYNNRGNAKNNLGRYQKAIGDYDEAIRLDPKYAYAYNNRGLAKNNLGRYQEPLGIMRRPSN